MDRLVDLTSEERRRRARIEQERFSPGPEHLASDDFFTYAQAQLTGRFDDALPAPELRRIESHLLQCESCLTALVEIEQVVASQIHAAKQKRACR
jgi:hypothetical protein